jgi:hypothetical protein
VRKLDISDLHPCTHTSSDMTPPQPPPDLGCAVHPNGSLKDASEIEWHFDKDDETPLTATEKSPGSGSASSTSSQTLHPFLLGHAQAPAIFVAGSRRSGRATCPSNRVVDPDNAMNSAPVPSSKKSKVVTGKRKASIQRSSSRCVVQKIVHLSGDSDDDNSDGEDHTPSQPTRAKSTDIKASEDAVSEQEYALLKAMADADHKVSATSTLKIIYFTHISLRQSTQRPRAMPLLTFEQSSAGIKSTRIQILGKYRMDIGASFACKQLVNSLGFDTSK